MLTASKYILDGIYVLHRKPYCSNIPIKTLLSVVFVFELLHSLELRHEIMVILCVSKTDLSPQ